MAMCSILYQLATRPEEQQKIYEELKQNIPDPNTPLTIQLLEKNKYTKSFIKEVLRMYSTVIGKTPFHPYFFKRYLRNYFNNYNNLNNYR
jgi:cytochrome P450